MSTDANRLAYYELAGPSFKRTVSLVETVDPDHGPTIQIRLGTEAGEVVLKGFWHVTPAVEYFNALAETEGGICNRAAEREVIANLDGEVGDRGELIKREVTV